MAGKLKLDDVDLQILQDLQDFRHSLSFLDVYALLNEHHNFFYYC